MASDWTPEEKHQLLKGLQQFGSTNIHALHKSVPTKTPIEIQVFCNEYAKAALNKDKFQNKVPPIKKWLLVLKRLHHGNPDNVHDLIPRILKYIALYEKRGGSKSLNLSQCYLALSTMCRGLDNSELDDNSEYFIYECLTKLGKCIKYSGCKSYQKYIRLKTTLNNVNESHIVLNPLDIPSSFTKGGNNAEGMQR
ncbi:uncharacterized protein [Diabrotica undecimpunctata]|uniref:uncharacterized protein n=1 Tax=Diabrotica undecimpunctata TaxID=50387 RepID=UPI003B640112